MQGLLDMKQSVWLDDLSREMTRSGELRALIDSGIRGLTSNPTIFEQAIGGSTAYDDDLNKWSMSPETDHDVYERLAIQDVREAADLFRPVYDATGGRDGFVSLEVSPAVARDTEGSVKEARHLWRAVDRPNAMIKIPGTREGWPAIERCLAEGININITLLFSVNHYRAVADAWLHALEARVESGKSIENLASVASFFVSRVDTEVDARIQTKGGSLLALQGKAAIAQAQLAYGVFEEIIQSDRWRQLEAKGARTQRLLWASTGTKNPAYPTYCTWNRLSLQIRSQQCRHGRCGCSKTTASLRDGLAMGSRTTRNRLWMRSRKGASIWTTSTGPSRTKGSTSSPNPSTDCCG